MIKFSRITYFISEYKKVIENYFFMTFLQFLNSFFYLAIYPYLILKLGVSQYGVYVFSISIITFFIYFVNFGFDIPALKLTSEHPNNDSIKSKVISDVFFSKLYLALFSFFIFIFIIFFVPVFQPHFSVMLIAYFQVIGAVFLPLWYFQALQKMKIITIIQLLVKVLTLPLIFIFVKNKTDVWVFALITSLGVLFSSIIGFVYIIILDKVKIKYKKINDILYMYKESLPYFFSVITGITKEQSIVILMGVFFGMREVALYDLAVKIISIPRTIFVSLNTAIFPKLINSLNKKIVKKIIGFEFLIGIIVFLIILMFGEYVIRLLGGGDMLEAYDLSLILSLTVTVWLVVGCFIYFVFVPREKSDIVFKNQLVALFSLFFFLAFGLVFINDIRVFAWAISLSGICEIIYCFYISKKLRLL
ncbi:oligosaccharide flippase family protein [Acinetobacter bereziniae]|uniref:oligosaccharide flippase family protein n=1 Tax=Acinetobacter bereziniae TaxID=106648 RepID=UPI00124EC716|nr:oligosaccharide flippase family protein [Acinetobacter bereziniae]